MSSALGATLLAMMPAFLIGGLSVFVQSDLDIDEAAFGIATGCFFAASCAFSMTGGLVGQRLQVRRALLLAPAAGVVAMLGIAVLADSLLVLVLFMVLGGLGNAFAQPAANRALSYGIPPGRQGLAFGVKQSAVPACSVLAGLAVPVVAQVGGWRWAVGGAAVLAYLLVLTAPRGHTVPEPAPGGARLRWLPLVLLSFSAALATAGTTATGTFLVQSVVDAGLDVALGGLLLATGNVLAIVVRVALGWTADRVGQHVWRVLAGVLVLAAGGFVILALAPVPALLVVGALLGTAMTSGWQGLFNYAVVRGNARLAAAATGITQTGVFSGGIVGPVIFGQIASRGSFPAAWWVMAGLSLASPVLMALARAHHRRSLTLEAI